MDFQQPTPGQIFADDVRNMVLDYCVDGVNAFLGCVGPALRRALTHAGASLEDERLLVEGSQRLYDKLVAKASSSLQLFEQLCNTMVFQAPAPSCIPKMEPVSLPEGRSDSFGSDFQSEEQLIAQIASMRNEISKVDQRCMSLHKELQHVDKVMATCGDTSSVRATAAIATSNKDAILAIAEAAEKLHVIMEKASRLRSSTQQDFESKVGTVKEAFRTVSNVSKAFEQIM
ncbi:hypothetical protein Vretimale_8926 [Volvox reticuliferus]|uniref:Uncharacterized protein n=1 Tax=Volvox reticuliferus TaxID=1737510 RepID=A0A8J4FVH3_9CHLO|nr:hypothetical protein Vretifemale_14383 [Volvox reticuliferus]GIM04342.1 hypothetical protein Vretimale_8926 [Volvox reticuliferus]